MSVEASPRSTTSTPWPVAPSVKARDSSTPDCRMSRASTMRGAPAKRAKAAPMASANRASSCPGTVPRMSYALKIVSSEAMPPSLYCRARGGRGWEDLVVRHVVGISEGSGADADEVARHLGGVAGQPYRRGVRAGQLDRHLEERQPVPLGQVEQLDVEGEAVDAAAGEQEVGHVGTEGLQPALRVAILAQEDGEGQEVEHPPAHVPQAPGSHERGRVDVAAA